jgi:energy-coupling factor transporter transmembrane protein EcfT
MSNARTRSVDERKDHTVVADSPLDTAALLAVIALIGLIVFLLWT